MFLGIDAGTTSLKAALFDVEGHLLASDRQEYSLHFPAPSWAEQDPEVYWRACCHAVKNVVLASHVDVKEVKALAISSQGETLIPLNAEGAPTYPAIVWLDNRASEEAEEIGRCFGTREVYRITGQPEITSTWPACKILWLRRNEPGVFSRTTHFLLLEDYLLYRLTGEFVTEYSLQASSLMLDIERKRWWGPMLEFIGISSDQLGHLREPGVVVGSLTAEGADAIGLSTQTLAVTGALDQVVGAVGAGNVVPGIVSETTGGALAIVVTLDRPLFDPQRRIPCHYHACRDTYCLLPWGQTAGMALRWFRDRFFHLEAQVARDSGLDPYGLMTAMASRIPPGADGLLMLPHLEGAACPEFDPSAKAVFYGATLKHTKAHFIRAIMESVAYMLKRNLDAVEELGIKVREIRSMGGGARSDLWLGIKADVLQKPVVPVVVEEAACLGAALMAAVAVGAFTGLAEGVSRMVHLRDAIEPDRSNRAVYVQGYSQYRELYERLKSMFSTRIGESSVQ